MKERAISLVYTTHKLERLAGDVKQGTGFTLFFSAETPKTYGPLGTIVSERSNWQKVVSGYLQKQMDCLPFNDAS